MAKIYTKDKVDELLRNVGGAVREFAPGVSYSNGDLVRHDGVVYECVSDRPPASDWNEAKDSFSQIATAKDLDSCLRLTDATEDGKMSIFADEGMESFIFKTPRGGSFVRLPIYMNNGQNIAMVRDVSNIVNDMIGFENYDPSTSEKRALYKVGAVVVHDSSLWKCVESAVEDTVWVRSHWEKTTVDKIKQDSLVDGINIKTVNGQSILGEGNIVISGGEAIDVPSVADEIIGNESGEDAKKVPTVGAVNDRLAATQAEVVVKKANAAVSTVYESVYGASSGAVVHLHATKEVTSIADVDIAKSYVEGGYDSSIKMAVDSNGVEVVRATWKRTDTARLFQEVDFYADGHAVETIDGASVHRTYEWHEVTMYNPEMAADSAKLGGVAASSYALAKDVPSVVSPSASAAKGAAASAKDTWTALSGKVSLIGDTMTGPLRIDYDENTVTGSDISKEGYIIVKDGDVMFGATDSGNVLAVGDVTVNGKVIVGEDDYEDGTLYGNGTITRESENGETVINLPDDGQTHSFPTATSDLTNDSGFVTADEIPVPEEIANQTQKIDASGNVYAANGVYNGKFIRKDKSNGTTLEVPFTRVIESFGKDYEYQSTGGAITIVYSSGNGYLKINGSFVMEEPYGLDPQSGDDLGVYEDDSYVYEFQKAYASFPVNPTDRLALESQLEGKLDATAQAADSAQLGGVDASRYVKKEDLVESSLIVIKEENEETATSKYKSVTYAVNIGALHDLADLEIEDADFNEGFQKIVGSIPREIEFAHVNRFAELSFGYGWADGGGETMTASFVARIGGDISVSYDGVNVSIQEANAGCSYMKTGGIEIFSGWTFGGNGIGYKDGNENSIGYYSYNCMIPGGETKNETLTRIAGVELTPVYGWTLGNHYDEFLFRNISATYNEDEKGWDTSEEMSQDGGVTWQTFTVAASDNPDPDRSATSVSCVSATFNRSFIGYRLGTSATAPILVPVTEKTDEETGAKTYELPEPIKTTLFAESAFKQAVADKVSEMYDNAEEVRYPCYGNAEITAY